LLIVEDLSVEKFDGPGKAGVERRLIGFGDKPLMNFPATVTLLPEATERVKSTNLPFGAVTTCLEKGNRLT
jgi:hypothetical protein